MPAAVENSPISLAGGAAIPRRRLFLVIAAYFLLQIVLRLLVSGSVELDEAEQVLLTQRIAWGYGSQPPLYTWLQACIFRVFGEGVLGLALLKNILLFGLYLFTFFAAREMAGEDRTATAATASLLFIPQIVWESQRDLTHSVLATAMAAATLYAAARVLRRGRVGDYFLLGLFAGLGVLGKYNYAVFLAALGIAALSLPEFRSRFRHPRILLSLLVMVLVTAGHFVWSLTHSSDLFRQAGTFHREMAPSLWIDYGRGTWSLMRAVLSFLGPLVGIYLLFFLPRSPGGSPEEAPSPFRSLLGRTLVSGILICLGLVLAFRVTNFKDRWMQPILFAAAVYFPFLVRHRLAGNSLRRLLTIAGVVAILVLSLLPARIFFASYLKGTNQLNAPFALLGDALRREGFEGGNIAASDRWLGGNLRLRFHGNPVFVPELPQPEPRRGAPWLVVWNAKREGKLPEALQHLCGSLPECRVNDPPRFIEAPSLYGDGVMRLGFLLVQPGG
jgi:4-amino-4-deoxy-L-arabinose transferase-like glycosyltransferase